MGGKVIKCNTLRRVKKLFGLIGQKVFIQNVLVSDGDRNMNGLEYAIWEKNIDIIQYLFSFDDIQKEYASNKELIWRCVWYMSGKYDYDESVSSYLMKALDLNEEKLRDLQKFKCTKPENDDVLVNYSYKKYWNETIDDKAV